MFGTHRKDLISIILQVILLVTVITLFIIGISKDIIVGVNSNLVALISMILFVVMSSIIVILFVIGIILNIISLCKVIMVENKHKKERKLYNVK